MPKEITGRWTKMAPDDGLRNWYMGIKHPHDGRKVKFGAGSFAIFLLIWSSFLVRKNEIYVYFFMYV